MRPVKRILVIRFRRVGDSILALSLLRTLKASFPDAEIDYVLDAGIAPLFEGHPAIGSVLAFTNEEKHSFPTYVRKVWRTVHTRRYDAIIDLRSTVQTLWFSLFSLRTPYRIGRRKGYNALLQNRRPSIPWNIDMVAQNLAFAAPLGEASGGIVESRDFSIPVAEEERLSFRCRMEDAGVDFGRPVVFCAVATRIPGKVWNKERMKATLRRIVDTYGAQLVFNYGGSAEEAYVKQMRDEMGGDPDIRIDIEARSLPELKAMLANCHFFFGNEGGPRHLAQAIGVPSFAIYPPNVGKHIWLPANDGSHQGIEFADVSAPDDTLTYEQKFGRVTVGEVWRRLSPMLDKYIRNVNRP